MKIPLEDRFEDIVGKAQRGLKLDDPTLAVRAGLSTDALARLKGGSGSREECAGLAAALGLQPDALWQSHEGSWAPGEVTLDGLAQFNSELLDMTVNAYVVYEPDGAEAAVFDTGADATELLHFLRSRNLRVRRVFITHTHEDHVAELDRIRRETGAPVVVPAKETLPDAEPVAEGGVFTVGRLTVRALLTNGHSAGGTTYVVEGLAVPVAVVGDSLFAGSMGGAPNGFDQALRNNREKVLTLPDTTVICPGHGPLTTVAEEKRHNPFYAQP